MRGQTGAGRVRRALTALGAAIALSLGFSAPVLGQPDPASTILQQMEQRADELAREGTPPTEGDPILTDPAARADLPPPGGATVLLRSVVFEPESAFLSDAELDGIAARYVGRDVDFSEISSLVRDVNDLYTEKGVVTASAILPPQTLEDGVLVVQLVEGRLGSVSIVGERRTRDDFIFDRVRLTRDGAVVDVPGAGEDITWFNKTHNAQLRLLLQPGAGFGLTDLTLGITEPHPHMVQVYLDNQGVASTGTIQWGASYRAYGLAGIDDNFNVFASGSEGSLAGTISVDAPFTRSGARLSLSYTASSIEVVNGPTAELGITGLSQAGTATVSVPLVAEAEWTVQGILSGSYGMSSSELSDMPLVDARTLRAVVGFALTYSDDTSDFGVQPQLVYANTEDLIAERFRDIILFTGSFNGRTRVADDVNLVGRGAWQYTEAQLLPGSLLFQVGGPMTVRGYPSSGMAGDSGYFAQGEVHWSLREVAEGLGVFAFGDFGEVFSTFPARTTLASAGVGMSYNWRDHVILDLTAAFPVLESMPDQADAVVYARITGRAF